MENPVPSPSVVNRRLQALRVKNKRKKNQKANPNIMKKEVRRRSSSSSRHRTTSSSSSSWISEDEIETENEDANETEQIETDIGDDGSITESESEDLDEEEEQEEPEDYCEGGYHPIKIGDIYNHKYEIIRKIGWGHFSTVWLCFDRFSRRYVALKVVKSEEKYTETARDEIKILRSILNGDPKDPNRNKIVQLLDEFKISGMHGVHVCMVMEVLGCNLLKLITGSGYEGIPLENVKLIIRQLLEGLDYLHEKCGIIHTDLKPENILLEVEDDYSKYLHDEAKTWKSCGMDYPPHAVCNFPEDVKKKVYPALYPSTDGNIPMSRNKKKKLKAKAKKVQMQQDQEQQKSKEDANESVEVQTEEGAAGDSNANDLNEDKLEPELIPYELHPDPSKEICKNIGVKIADLGNACYVDRHFTDDIQTRQYRSFEVITGAGYGPQSDIWSVACIAFELATGDYLFNPSSGEDYSRDEDHIAHIIELIGPVSRRVALTGKYSHEIFDRRGKLRHIKNLKPWNLYRVLHEKYQWTEQHALEFSDFLMPMLTYDWKKRATARDCLTHPFLS